MSDPFVRSVVQQPPSIPDFELLHVIGRGAYGEVWLARNVIGSFAALKIVRRAAFEHERPYEREFEGIKRYEPISRADPSQLPILHVGRGDGFFYYVMELADDAAEAGASRFQVSSSARVKRESGNFKPEAYLPHTLKRLLNERGALSVEECLTIALSLTRPLAYLHSQGLVHRDVKPSNIVFVNGVPKLADIGLVASTETTMSFVGTSGFLPPEGPGTPQADLYSLGKVLYEISTGRDRQEFPKLPGDLAESKERQRILELNAVILKACAPNPRERYQSAQEMHAELELLRRGNSVQRRRLTSQRLAVARKSLWICAGATLMTAAVVLLLRTLRPDDGLSSINEANRLYREGEYKIHSSTPAETKEAFTNFTEAIRIDPTFVKPYFGLFQVYINESDDNPKIRPLAEELKAIAPSSVESLTLSSYVHWLDWEFDEAIATVRQAIQRDQKWSWAHGLCGFYLLHARGQVEHALKEYSAAAENSTIPIFKHHLGHPFYFRRDFTNAIIRYDRSLRLEPRHTYGHYWLGRSYQALKDFERALDHFQKRDIALGKDAVKAQKHYDGLRAAFRTRGETGYWQAQLDAAKAEPSFDPYELAALYAHLNQTNEVWALLDKAYSQHNNKMVYLLFEEHWDGLRKNPRFRAIVKKVGLSLN